MSRLKMYIKNQGKRDSWNKLNSPSQVKLLFQHHRVPPMDTSLVSVVPPKNRKTIILSLNLDYFSHDYR